MIVPVWADINNGRKTNFLYTQDNPAASLGAAGAIIDAMVAMSSCGLVQVRLQPILVVGATPSTGAYPTVLDLARFAWRTTVGTIVRTNIAGPIEDIFLADHETVDVTNPLVMAYIAAMQLAGSDSDGNPILTLVVAKRGKMQPPWVP